MIISKAIEILTIAAEAENFMPDPDYRDAQKLGIEALKREEYNRLNQPNLIFGPLPGETPENEK